MKFQIRKDDMLIDDTIIIACHPRNLSYAENVLLYLQKNNVYFNLYDDLHNLYQVALSTVYYLENIDNKVYVYTKDQIYRSYLRFACIKNIYHAHGFYQINKHTLVNINHIHRIQIQAECRRMLTLDNGERLIVNRHFARAFNEVMKVK